MVEHGSLSEGAASIQEQVIARILSSLVPANALETRRNSRPDEAPALGLATLTTNFRKFSSRIGVVFKAQAIVDSIYRWKNPRETLSYGMIWTLVCLVPYLVFAIPFTAALFCLLVPAFLQLHPAPPANIPLPPDLDAWSTNTGRAKYFGGTAEGRDFLLNMRDIQNAMDDYVKAYDQLSETITQHTNFVNEKKSSVTLFVCVLGITLAVISAAYVPVRFLMLFAGWMTLFSGHPSFKVFIMRMRRMSRKPQEKLVAEVARTVDHEYITPETSPEIRLVNVYEYRKDHGERFYSGFSTIGNAGTEDEYVTSNLEAVRPPLGYAFVKDSLWSVATGEDLSLGSLQRATLKRKVVRQL